MSIDVEAKELVLSRSPALSKSVTPPLEAEHVMMLRQLFSHTAATILRKSRSPSLTSSGSTTTSSISLERTSINQGMRDIASKDSLKSISTQQTLLVLEHFYLRSGCDDKRLKDFISKLDDDGLIDFSLIGLELSRTQQLRSQFLHALLSISGTPLSPQSSSSSLGSPLTPSSSPSSSLLALTPTLVRAASNGVVSPIPTPGSDSGSSTFLAMPPSIQYCPSSEESLLAHGFVEEARLGRGSFGSVSKVHNIIDGMTYAVKRIPFTVPLNVSADAYLDKVRREVCTLAQLDHPNILRYYSCWINIKDINNESSRRKKDGERKHEDGNEDDGDEDDDSDEIDEEDEFSFSAPKALHAGPNDDLSGLIKFSNSRSTANEENSSTATIEDESRSSASSAKHNNHSLLDDSKSQSPNEKSTKSPPVNLPWFDDSKTPTPSQELNKSPPVNLPWFDDSKTPTPSQESNKSPSVNLPWFDDSKSQSPTRKTEEEESSSAATVEDETISSSNVSWSEDGKTISHYSPSVGTHSGEDSKPGALVKYVPSPTPQHVERVHFIMYLQTQFCNGGSLREWLDNPERCEVDKLASFDIFRGILKGVAHIHSRGIVHRDLKPANIFFDIDDSGKRTIKIGDFGLAKMLPYESTKGGHNSKNKLSTDKSDLYEDNMKLSTLSTSAQLSTPLNNTRGVGTVPYASPEQISHVDYSFSADIYSLGIILLELYSVFSTGSERIHVISDLKNSNKLPVSMVAKYPSETQLIRLMTTNNPDQRPTASDILNHPVFRLLDRTSAPMDKSQLEQEVAELKQMLRIREEQLSRLSVEEK